MIDRATLETLLGFKIHNPSLYQQAFTHVSAVSSEPTCGGACSYERMEFMGDSVINLIVTRYLFDKYPDRDEGFLTRIRTKLVSGKCLVCLAKKLNLQQYIHMNDNALAKGWNNNDRILEDVFEALVGCVYTDLGLLMAKIFLLSLIEWYINNNNVTKDDNYKDILMRYTQAQKGVPLPVYNSIEAIENNSKVFVTYCYVDNKACGYGRHKSKKFSQQQAAHQALQYLNCGVE